MACRWVLLVRQDSQAGRQMDGWAGNRTRGFSNRLCKHGPVLYVGKIEFKKLGIQRACVVCSVNG